MPAAAGKGKRGHHKGFKTSQGPMLDPLVPGASVEPLLTVGETLPGSSYKFESIPDGIALRKGHGHTVQVYVNHETSAVPFPFNPATGVGVTNFTNALLSKLTLDRHSGGTSVRQLRDPERGELPALLLELLGVAQAGVRASDRLHERGSDRLREPHGNRLAARRRVPSRPAWSSRTTCAAASTSRSTAWAGTTTRTASRSSATTTRSCSPATTPSRRPRPSSTCTWRGTRGRSGTTRATCGPSRHRRGHK